MENPKPSIFDKFKPIPQGEDLPQNERDLLRNGYVCVRTYPAESPFIENLTTERQEIIDEGCQTYIAEEPNRYKKLYIKE